MNHFVMQGKPVISVRVIAINLLLLVTMTPFSVENASEGSPCIFHSLTAAGLPRNEANV